MAEPRSIDPLLDRTICEVVLLFSNTFFGDRDYHATSSFDLSEAWSIDLLGLELEVENARRDLIRFVFVNGFGSILGRFETDIY